MLLSGVAMILMMQLSILTTNMPEAYVNLGLIYYAQARFEDSSQALSAANKLKFGMRGVSLGLGIDEVKLHKPARTAALLRAAVRQDPSDKSAQLGLVLRAEGKPAQAAPALAQVQVIKKEQIAAISSRDDDGRATEAEGS
jgi:cytochrome c-type biogenesis protein CcmH/NrfG